MRRLGGYSERSPVPRERSRSELRSEVEFLSELPDGEFEVFPGVFPLPFPVDDPMLPLDPPDPTLPLPPLPIEPEPWPEPWEPIPELPIPRSWLDDPLMPPRP